MIPWILALVPDKRWAGPLLAIGAAIGIILLVVVAVRTVVSNRDDRLIQSHDARLNTEAITRNADLSEVVADKRLKDAVDAERAKGNLERIVKDETKPVDDRRAAYRQCVRLQQRAAKAGLSQPVCR